jgi:hypothetical protein
MKHVNPSFVCHKSEQGHRSKRNYYIDIFRKIVGRQTRLLNCDLLGTHHGFTSEFRADTPILPIVPVPGTRTTVYSE